MPTIAEATAPRDTSSLEPVAAPLPPTRPPLPARANLPGANPLVLGNLPTIFGSSPDFQRNFYRPGTSQTRIPPLPPQANVAVGAATRSQIIVQQASPAIDLQVNGVDNPDQTKLNLTGTAVVYGPGPGQVAITAGSGDGLVHGDPIWDLDSSVAYWRDDFKLGTATVTTNGASTFGELKWDGVTASGGAWNKGTSPHAFPHVGWVNSVTGATASTYSAIFFPFANTAGAFHNAMPLLDYPGWKMVWVFGTYNFRSFNDVSIFPLTKKQLYIGLSPCLYSVTWAPGGTVNARPPYFLGLRFDTDTTSPAIGDSTFHFEIVANPNFAQTRNNTQGTVVDTGITPTEFTSYRLEMTYKSSSSLTMSLYGSDGSNATHTFTSIPTLSSIAGTGGLVINLARKNGLGGIVYAANASFGTSNAFYAIGSKFTISGNTDNAAFNTSGTIIGDGLGTPIFIFPGSNISTSPANAGTTITGYPGLTPYFGWGNDTQSTPDSATIGIDFFSLVWNSGLASSPLALTSLASRFTTGS